MKTRIIVALVVSLVTITSAIAQTGVDARQKSQRLRIHEGRQDGEITRKEATLLRKQQRHIRRCEFKAKADGHVSARENIKLNRKHNNANRSIYRAKHNNVERKD